MMIQSSMEKKKWTCITINRYLVVPILGLLFVSSIFSYRWLGITHIQSFGENIFTTRNGTYGKIAPRPRAEVLLYTYARGGSTVAGEMFNRNPHAVYWYEPLSTFYAAYYGLKQWTHDVDLRYTDTYQIRRASEEEQVGVQHYLEDIFRCSFDASPTELFSRVITKHSASMIDGCKAGKGSKNYRYCNNKLIPYCGASVYQALNGHCHGHLTNHSNSKSEWWSSSSSSSSSFSAPAPKHIRDYKQCVSTKFHKPRMKCQRYIEQRCSRSTIIAAKLNKVALGSLEPFIKANQHVKIVYYVRDPRGIMNSRWDTGRKSALGRKDIVADAALLCQVMHEDYISWRRLSKMFPRTFILFRYEDFIQEPLKTASKVYDFIGLPLPEELSAWISKDMNAEGSEKNPHSTSRSNGTATSTRWQRNLPQKDIQAITLKCHQILTELGYEQ